MFTCFIHPGQISNEKIIITEGNFHHLKNVLHANPGEPLRVRSDRFLYECEIEHIGRNEITAKILNYHEVAPEYRHKFIAASAILQEKRFDLLLQFSAQMGVSEIHPIITSNTTTHEIKPGRTERWRKIVHAACMQSQRNFIPSVEEPALLKDEIQKIIALKKTKPLAAYELEENRHVSDLDFADCDTIAFFTGPEGGFTSDETAMMASSGIKLVSLGNNILRAETAALVTLTLIQQKLGYV